MTTWIEDTNGNKCSVEYFGSKEAAQTALDSLKGCKGCINCSYCSRCSDCSYCSRCSDCSRCSGCSDCSYCSGLKNDVKIEIPTIPIIENIHKRIYEASSNPNALAMENVHTCTNTHCRAGWVITLAGEAGAALEQFYNWELAAMLIYDASDPNYKINPARFYDSNEDALADMKKLAKM